MSWFKPVSGRVSIFKIILSGLGIVIYLNTLFKGTFAEKTQARLETAEGFHICYIIFDSLYMNKIKEISEKHRYHLLPDKFVSKVKTAKIFDASKFIPIDILNNLVSSKNNFHYSIELDIDSFRINYEEVEDIKEEINNIIEDLLNIPIIESRQMYLKIFDLINNIYFFQPTIYDAKHVQEIFSIVYYSLGSFFTIIIIYELINKFYMKQKNNKNHRFNISPDIETKKMIQIIKKFPHSSQSIKLYILFKKKWTCPIGDNFISTPFHHPKYPHLFDLRNLSDALNKKSYKYKNVLINPDDFNFDLLESLHYKTKLLNDINEIMAHIIKPKCRY